MKRIDACVATVIDKSPSPLPLLLSKWLDGEKWLVNQSFKIFPYTIANGRKKPLIEDWEINCSADPAVHKLWCEQFRERLVGWGMPTKPNGLFALDIDAKPGKVNGLEYLKSKGIQIPPTAHQYTMTGGLHLFFRDRPDLQLRNTANPRIGIDSRGGGGFVWLYQPRFDLPVLDIPEWVLELVKKPVDEPVTQANVVTLNPVIALNEFSAAIEKIKNAAEGERNHTLNQQSYVIGKLVRGGAIPADFAANEIIKAGVAAGLDIKEIKATLNSGLGSGYNNPLTHPFGDQPPTPAIQIAAPPPTPEAIVHERWTPKFTIESELLNWQALKRPQLFKDWMPQDIILTAAVGGVGKTTIKLFEAVCLAVGEPFLGFECLRPGRTLFIIGEDSEAKLKAMLGRICKQLGYFNPENEHKKQAVLQNIVIKRPKDLQLVQFNRQLNNYTINEDAERKLKEAIDDLRPAQIIFDPIAMFQGPESGGNDAARAMMEFFQRILEHSDAAIDIISHVGKSSASINDVSQFASRGASAVPNHSRVVRTMAKLNPKEYQDLMGEELSEDSSAMRVFISKFSDGSPYLDKPFIILRSGYSFMKKEIPVQSSANFKQDDQNRLFEHIKHNSHEGHPISAKLCCEWFNVQSPKISKSRVMSLIEIMKAERILVEFDHPDVSVGKYLMIRDF